MSAKSQKTGGGLAPRLTLDVPTAVDHSPVIADIHTQAVDEVMVGGAARLADLGEGS